jgi:hypothetical protein
MATTFLTATEIVDLGMCTPESMTQSQVQSQVLFPNLNPLFTPSLR